MWTIVNGFDKLNGCALATLCYNLLFTLSFFLVLSLFSFKKLILNIYDLIVQIFLNSYNISTCNRYKFGILILPLKLYFPLNCLLMPENIKIQFMKRLRAYWNINDIYFFKFQVDKCISQCWYDTCTYTSVGELVNIC